MNATTEKANPPDALACPPPPPPRETKPPRRRGCLKAFILAAAFVTIAAGLILGIGGYLVSKISRWSEKEPRFESGIDESPPFHEVWSAGSGKIKIIRIPLNGMISLGDSGWNALSEGSAAFALQSIRKATHDRDVRALLVEIDSGGGGVTASDVIFRELRNFSESSGDRLVMVHMGDVSASGAYYVAVASDWIIAHPTTLTGSIGVLMKSINLKEMAAKIGIRDVTIKSGSNKDLLNPLEDLTPEQREMLQRIVDSMHDRFVGIVAEGRGLPIEEVEPIADGGIMLAEEALRLGLIDQIGYHDDAMVKLRELLDEEQVCLYRYQPRVSFMDFFSRPALFGAWLHRILQTDGTRFMYRWPF